MQVMYIYIYMFVTLSDSLILLPDIKKWPHLFQNTLESQISNQSTNSDSGRDYTLCTHCSYKVYV